MGINVVIEGNKRKIIFQIDQTYFQNDDWPDGKNGPTGQGKHLTGITAVF